MAERSARRRLRRIRRLRTACVLCAPGAWIVGVDVARRARILLALDRLHQLGWLATAAVSFGFWAIVILAASGRRGQLRYLAAALFIGSYSLVAGVQGAFWNYFGAYDSLDAVIHLRSFAKGILAELPLDRPAVAVQLVIGAGAAVALWMLSSELARPRRRTRRMGQAMVPFALAGMAFMPASYRVIEASTPDVLYFNGLAGLFKQVRGRVNWDPLLRPMRRHPEHVPPLAAKPARLRNLLFILQESQRYDVTCTAYDPNCSLPTKTSNGLLPDRIPFLRMHANDTATAISISVLWSGLPPNASRDALIAAPLIWDYARAAGYDTAYWTSQNLLFENLRLYVEDLPVSHFACATNIDHVADWDTGCRDSALTQRVIHEWDELKEPFVAVVQYSNQHMPYVYDARYAPYQPAEPSGPIERKKHPFNFYKDVVYLSDLAVAKLIDHVRHTDSGSRTIIVYTADHGEQVGDRRGWGHTWALWEQQLHVPAWIDAPRGTLSPDEETSLRRASSDWTYHVDLAATMFDLLGLWDAPGFAPFRARMFGLPLTRGPRSTGMMPLTNCANNWECITPNWGVMQGPIKVHKGPIDLSYRCNDIARDPGERVLLTAPICRDLEAEARRLFPDPATSKPPHMPLRADGIP